jgi:hypothetical protein
VTTFERIPRERLEELAREAYARQFPRRRPQDVRSRNVRPTLLLVDGDRIEIPYRGRIYELLPVSFRDGLRLLEMRTVLEDLEHAPTNRENVRRYVAALRAIIALAPKYLRPRGRIRRALWAFTRNPFRGATDREVGELLGFFLGCRMRSRVQYQGT